MMINHGFTCADEKHRPTRTRTERKLMLLTGTGMQNLVLVRCLFCVRTRRYLLRTSEYHTVLLSLGVFHSK